MQNLSINPELKSLIPPLTAEEFKQLETNVCQEGIREPIITWQGTIVDGHNRYELAQMYDLPFKVKEMAFASMEDCMDWMINNQLGRRNVTETQKAYLIGKKYENEKQRDRFKGNQHTGGGGNFFPHQKTAERLGEEFGISDRQVKNNEDFAKGVDLLANVEPELKGQILQGKSDLNKQDVQEFGKISKQAQKEVKQSAIFVSDEELKRQINERASEMAKVKLAEMEEEKKRKIEEKKAERIELIEKQKRDIQESKLMELNGLYDVISVDPPWNYGREYDPETSRVANPYPEMSSEQIKALRLPFSNDSILFLWTTHKFLPDAFEILKEWGFEYKATLVWNKEKIGMGAWFRMQCEFCLFAVKGKPFWSNTTERDIIVESRREHSRKPDAFFNMVDKLCVGRKLEYFSREQREGWEVYGNDTNKF
jgi:N6-adenosine-specific RNA methylase IME4